MLSDVLVKIIGYFALAIYNFSTVNNLKRFCSRIVHKASRYWRIFLYSWFGTVCSLSNWGRRKTTNKVNTRSLSLFLHDVLDKTNIWWRTRARFLIPYMEFEECLIGQVYGKDIVRVKYVGSYRETIPSLHYADTASDIDIMYIYKNFDVSGQSPTLSTETGATFNTKIVDADVPGYVYVKLVEPVKHVVNDFRKIAMKGEFHASLEIDKLVEYFEREVVCDIDSLGTNSRLSGEFLRSDTFIVMQEKFNRERFAGWLLFNQCGPASKIFWNVSGLPQRIKICPLDMVFALHCPHWPAQAAEWKLRRRKYNFPGNSLIKKIIGYGVDIVAKSSCVGGNGEDSPLEWRLSFSIAEVALVDKWNETQKSCYRILKTFHTDHFARYSISSYSIKNIMFYLIERKEPSLWKPENLVKCIFMVLRSVIKSLETKSCPHYFIKENNLFRGIPDDKLNDAVNICGNLLSDMYGRIWISDGMWYEICARGMKKYFYCLQTSPTKTEKMHQNHVNSRPEWNRNLGVLFKIYYCVKIHKEVSNVFLNGSRSKHYDEWVVIDALERILRRSVASRAFHSHDATLIYCHVAWVYIKCLLWIEKIKLDQEAWKEGTPREERKYYHSLGDARVHDRVEEAYKMMKLLDMAYALKISLVMDILSGSEITSSCSPTRESIADGMPVVVCQLDRLCHEEVVAEFPYRYLAYYCPMEQLLCYAQLKQREEKGLVLGSYSSYQQLERLMGNTYTKQFRTIMKPFADHLHQKILALQ